MSGLFVEFTNLSNAIGSIFNSLPAVVQILITSFFGITFLFAVLKMFKG